MPKEKTKAELLEENERLKKLNANLTNDYKNSKNGNEVGCFTYNFTVTEFSKEYLDDLLKRTTFVSRKVIINGGKNHDCVITKEMRKWPDNNRVVIVSIRPKGTSLLSKVLGEASKTVIEYYDYRVDTPLNI